MLEVLREHQQKSRAKAGEFKKVEDTEILRRGRERKARKRNGNKSPIKVKSPRHPRGNAEYSQGLDNDLKGRITHGKKFEKEPQSVRSGN